jgi:hypothetical protein
LIGKRDGCVGGNYQKTLRGSQPLGLEPGAGLVKKYSGQIVNFICFSEIKPKFYEKVG